MKSKENLLSQLKSLPYFSRDSVHQLGSQLGLKGGSADVYISRFLRRGEIIQLKKGLFVSLDFLNTHRGDISYPFYLANIIRTPSYVSSWAALQYYNLTTEAIRAITSVTTKVTRSYRTKVGSFAYQSIDRGLFSNFSLVNGEFPFFIATPAKALFDLLYFRTRQFRGIHLKDIEPLVESLRLDLDEMDRKSQREFRAMVRKYLYE